MTGCFRYSRTGLGVFSLLLGGFAFGLFLSLARQGAEEGSNPGRGYVDGQELVMLYLSSPSCLVSSSDELLTIVQALKLSLESTAEERGMSFVSIGIGIDWNIPETVRHFERFGAWDELMLGRSWLNAGAVRYVWGRHGGFPAVPQVVVLSRSVRATPGLAFAVEDETVLVRYVGREELVHWVEHGAPVPRLSGLP